jgi:hypothetical protein
LPHQTERPLLVIVHNEYAPRAFGPWGALEVASCAHASIRVPASHTSGIEPHSEASAARIGPIAGGCCVRGRAQLHGRWACAERPRSRHGTGGSRLRCWVLRPYRRSRACCLTMKHYRTDRSEVEAHAKAEYAKWKERQNQTAPRQDESFISLVRREAAKAQRRRGT